MEQSLERYSRQMRFYGIGEDGQRRLLESHVTLCGCGALGTVLANALVRAGVGHLRLVDRDFIETNNLQRQVLFDEHDVAENLPKAEAAARNIVASYQATEALKILTGRRDQINRDLIYVDVWENIQRRIKIAPLLGKVDCPCCRRRRFEWLDGEHGAQTTSLCGRNAVQVAHRSATRLNFEELARHLEAVGDVSYNRFLFKFKAVGFEFSVFT